jgi:hypothetical protein
VETCLHPWLTVKPVGCTLASLYSPCTYISCYVTINKLLLSYLLLRLLPQVVTLTRLYPLYCTLYFCTLTHCHLQAQVALSLAFVSEVFVSILQCALHWLQLSKHFLLTISLRNLPTFVLFFLLKVGRSYHSTQFWTSTGGADQHWWRSVYQHWWCSVLPALVVQCHQHWWRSV